MNNQETITPVAPYGTAIQTADQIKASVQLIQNVMRSVMKPGVHYGTIPGCEKPSLYKPGSEILLSTFQISVEPEVIDLSTQDEVRFRVLAKGIHRKTGTVVGIGVGECSSNEEKYKWRKAVCDEEWNETPEDRRREKWCKGNRDKKTGKYIPYKLKQVRTEIADVANIILKMAKKRAQIDMTLTAIAASDIFTQDAEDMPEEMFDDIPVMDEPMKVGASSTIKAQESSKPSNSDRWNAIITTAKELCITSEEVKAIIAPIVGSKPLNTWTDLDFTAIKAELLLFSEQKSKEQEQEAQGGDGQPFRSEEERETVKEGKGLF